MILQNNFFFIAKFIFRWDGIQNSIEMNHNEDLDRLYFQDPLFLLHKSQLVIFAAPAYWANVPAPVKNVFDR